MQMNEGRQVILPQVAQVAVPGMDLALTHFPSQLHRWRPPLPPPPSSFAPLHTRHVRYGKCAWSSNVRVRASDVGAGSFDGGTSAGHGANSSSHDASSSSSAASSSNQWSRKKIAEYLCLECNDDRLPPTAGIRYPLSIAGVLAVSAAAFAVIVGLKGGPSVVKDALAKSGFTAAFALIFVSEIGDKTFFIAALLAMQYKKALVFLGSMGALSLMTIFSVAIGRIFQSVPAQFQTTLPIGEYAAVALLTFFGLKSIKDAWELPSGSSKDSDDSSEQLGELVEAEELVKEKVAKKLTSALEIVWKSFSLVFFAEWGDRSMLATIALGAAQSPIGVASGGIAGHLAATSVAILGGAFLANYISEKMVGLLGGVLFLIFAAATLFGVF